MSVESFQPALSRAIHESLGRVIVENMPPITEELSFDGVLRICLSAKRIVVNIRDTIQPPHKLLAAGTAGDGGGGDASSGRSSPWQIPLDAIRDAQQRFLSFNGHSAEPVDLRAARDTATSKGGANSASQSPLTVSANGDDAALDFTKSAASAVQLNEGRSNTPASMTSSAALNDVDGADAAEPTDLTTPKTASTAAQELTCKVCSQRFTGGLSVLQAHTKEQHNRYVCRYCFNTFTQRYYLKRHESLHRRDNRVYKCPLCTKAYSLNIDLRRHMREAHGVTATTIAVAAAAEEALPVMVACTKCDRSFAGEQALHWHLYKAHKQSDPRTTFACTICELLFRDRDEYVRHRDEHASNLIASQPDARAGSPATTESATESLIASEIDDDMIGDDSDNDQLMIDTQSVASTADHTEAEADASTADRAELENGALPMYTEASNNSDDVGLELVNEPRAKDVAEATTKTPAAADSDVTARATDAPTPTPSQASVGSRSGSRKRKIGKPIKIEMIGNNDEDEVGNLNDMYFSPEVAQKSHASSSSASSATASASAVSAANYLSQTEPENLVMKPRVSTPPTSVAVPFNIAANALSQIALSVKQNFLVASNSLTAGSAAVSFASPPQLVGLRNIIAPAAGAPRQVPAITFPNATPILITPQAGFQQNNNKLPIAPPRSTPPSASKRQKTGNVPNSITKSKIASTSHGFGENTELQCSEIGCNEIYMGFSAYEDHCMLRHGRFPCKYCKQTFSGKNNRTRHMRCHLGAKTYTCPDCHKNFSRPDSMREHQFIHTLSYQEDKCRNCGAAFDKKNMLLAHLKQCYRHKMETGKSTKYIDETPTYPGTPIPQPILSTSTASNAAATAASDALPPLKPIKLENIPAFKHIDSANLFVPSTTSSAAAAAAAAVTSSMLAINKSDHRASPATSFNAALNAVTPSPRNSATSSPLNLSAPPSSFPSLQLPLSLPSPLVIAPISGGMTSTSSAARDAFTTSGASSSSLPPLTSPLFMPQGAVNTTALSRSLLATSLLREAGAMMASRVSATTAASSVANSSSSTPSALPLLTTPSISALTVASPNGSQNVSAAAALTSLDLSTSVTSKLITSPVKTESDQNANMKAPVDGTVTADQ